MVANRRWANERIMDAQVTAAGSHAGFTGDWGAIEGLYAALLGQEMSKKGSDLQQRLMKFARAHGEDV